jgi:hypothetical protein
MVCCIAPLQAVALPSIDEGEWTEHAVVMLLLIHERAKGEASQWSDWLAMIPDECVACFLLLASYKDECWLESMGADDTCAGPRVHACLPANGVCHYAVDFASVCINITSTTPLPLGLLKRISKRAHSLSSHL